VTLSADRRSNKAKDVFPGAPVTLFAGRPKNFVYVCGRAFQDVQHVHQRLLQVFPDLLGVRAS
jgi:hypothetical protein